MVLAPHAPPGVPVLVAAGSALLAGLWPTAHSDPPPPHHWADEADADQAEGANGADEAPEGGDAR